MFFLSKKTEVVKEAQESANPDKDKLLLAEVECLEMYSQT